MTTTPLPCPVAHLRIAESWDVGAIVITCSSSHEEAKPVFVLEDLQAYAQQARADLEAENQRLREVLKGVISDLEYEGSDGWMTGQVHSDEYKAAMAALESKP